MIEKLTLVFIAYWLVTSSTLADKPPLQQGVSAPKTFDVTQYWISEKLDGVRGYWDGSALYTRQGNLIQTPSWFTSHWPKTPLDGEIWAGRGKFQSTVSCVKNLSDDDKCWKGLRLMVFDLPSEKGVFTQRNQKMQKMRAAISSPYIAFIKQTQVRSLGSLHQLLHNTIETGGEGLMLHHQHAHYITGRNSKLLKLKKHDDDDAIVIKHLPGKGKFTGILGALLVETKQGIRFKIGTGFSLQQRKQPPPVGSTITFKYIGKTKRGVPRFASFLRVRAL